MKFNIPVVTVKAVLAVDLPSFLKKAGEIVEIPYGTAVIMKAMGGVKFLMDEDACHVHAAEQLNTYGADALFNEKQQTSSRLAEWLAEVGFQTPTVQ